MVLSTLAMLDETYRRGSGTGRTVLLCTTAGPLRHASYLGLAFLASASAALLIDRRRCLLNRLTIVFPAPGWLRP